MNWPLFQNSLLLATAATMLAVAAGFMAALWASAAGPRARLGLLGLAGLSFALPPFLVTNCWLDLLGHTGVWRKWLPWNIYSLGGAIWVLALMTWPVTLFLLWGCWTKLEPSHLESEPLLRGATFVRALLVPMARGELASAAVLTFALTLNSFAVPAILQVKVFTAEMWVSYSTQLNPVDALALSWPLLLVPLALWFWLSRRELAWPRLEGGVSHALFRGRLGRSWGVAAAFTGVVLLGLSLVLPMTQLVGSSRTWVELPQAIAAGQRALGYSLFFAAFTATCVTLVAVATWFRPLGSLAWAAFFVPGILLGIGFIVVCNRPGLDLILRTGIAVVLAMGLRYLGPGWNTVAQALRGQDRDLADVARLHGVRGWPLWREVLLPMFGPRLAAAWYVTYLLCLWDVEALVLLVPPGVETLALRVFNLLHYGHAAQVNALCLALLLLALAPLLVWWSLSALRWNRPFGSSKLKAQNSNGRPRPPSSSSSPKPSPQSQGVFVRTWELPWSLSGTSNAQRSTLSVQRSWNVERSPQCVSLRRGSGISAECRTLAPFAQGWARGVGLIPVWPNPRGKRAALAQEPPPCGERPEHSHRHPSVPSSLECTRPSALTYSNRFLSMLVEDVGAGGRATGGAPVAAPGAGALPGPFHGLGAWCSRAACFWKSMSPQVGLALLTVVLTGCDSGSAARTAVDSRFFREVQVIGSRGTGPGQFNKPRSLATDNLDNLYVVDMTGRVQKFSPEGEFLLGWQMPETDLGKAKGMTCDAAGNIVVVEPHYARVNHYDASGKLRFQWGNPGTNAGQLAFPRAVAADSHGELWVSEYSKVERVQRFTADGARILRGVGRPGEGPGEFQRAEGIGVDSQDRLYVADSCNHRIQVFSREGRFVRMHGRAGEGAGEMSYPYDVCVDAAGQQYVCEFGNSRIQIFDAADRLLETLGRPGIDPGHFANPWAITLDSQGNLYVADALNHRVQKFVRRPETWPGRNVSTPKA